VKKTEFFHLLNSCSKNATIQVAWGIARPGQGIVYVTGSFLNRTVRKVELRRPEPACRDRDVLAATCKLCEREAAKYARWLLEYTMQKPRPVGRGRRGSAASH
jgi:hypothetical protein